MERVHQEFTFIVSGLVEGAIRGRDVDQGDVVDGLRVKREGWIVRVRRDGLF